MIFILPSFGIGQELAPIQNFSPLDYDGDNQNWAITQSEKGFIYIANMAGLLCYDSERWQIFPSPNGTNMRSVHAKDNRIYSGSYMEFGYWEKNNYGQMLYQSLSSKVAEGLVEDEEFWKIMTYGDWILFQSLDRIYLYNPLKEAFNIIPVETTRDGIFKIGERIIYQQLGLGIFEIIQGNGELLIEDKKLREEVLIGAFEYKGDLLFITNQGSFLLWDGVGVNSWEIPASAAIRGMSFLSAIQLNDGSIILGTISNGIVEIDENGYFVNTFNQENGLQNNTILGLYEDRDSNVWIACDNGISIINKKSQFKEFLDQNGRLGVVYTAYQGPEYFYLGTNQGLFYRDRDSDGDLKIIENTQGQVWFLKEYENTLFCGHNNGTFVIQGNRAIKISNIPGAWDVIPLPGRPDLLLQGSYDGLGVLERKSGNWMWRNMLTGFQSSSRFVNFLGDRQIVVNHEYKGVFFLETDSDYREIVEMDIRESKGIGSSLFKFDDSIIYATQNGVFRLDHQARSFIRDTLLSNLLYDDSDPVQGIVNIDAKNNILTGVTARSLIFLNKNRLSGEYEINRIPVPAMFHRNLGVSGFENINHIEDYTYLIGITNGFVIVDLTDYPDFSHELYLTSASMKAVDSLKINLPLASENIEIPPRTNTIRFEFAVPEYDKFTDVNYQYQLEGYHQQWSEWSDRSEISFQNLPYRDFKFKVRSRVGNTLSENSLEYNFTISKPWYASRVAKALYLIGFIALVVVVHASYRNYYKKKEARIKKETKKKLKRKKLKTQRRIAQLKNEQLMAQVENKTRELSISTMGMVRKNEFLGAIKDQLQEVSSSPVVQSVIKTIDQNIDADSDWKLFKEAFNNADNRFLDKIKEAHPELTPNDLRLCAYLRLNLSSKEVAPLLNISVRSVEVKRYRLRKKMQLSPETNLVDYILSV